MNNNFTEIIFILDRSGSMSGLETDTIGGYNSMIEKQKKEVGDAVVTTVLFDDKYEIIHDRADVNKINPLTIKEYYARGSTALLDAVGKTISQVKARNELACDNEIPKKVMVIITTDGFENSSREFTLPKIKEMITERKEKAGWEFLFMGANIDAVATASLYGIDADRSVTYFSDKEGTRRNFDAMCSVASCIRGEKEVSTNWKKDIEEYINKKTKR